jgi:hypothetical protein
MLPCEIKVFGSHAQGFLGAGIARPCPSRGLHGTVIKRAAARDGRLRDMVLKRPDKSRKNRQEFAPSSRDRFAA